MSDRRRIKIVITAISIGDNFETAEKNDEALSEIMDIAMDDRVSLYRALMECKQLLEVIEDEDLDSKSLPSGAIHHIF